MICGIIVNKMDISHCFLLLKCLENEMKVSIKAIWCDSSFNLQHGELVVASP